MGSREKVIEPPALLARLGIRADKIKTLIVTHFHQDHFTGMDYFSTAKFVTQRAELEFWTGPLMPHDVFAKQIHPKMRPAVARNDKPIWLRSSDCESAAIPATPKSYRWI